MQLAHNYLLSAPNLGKPEPGLIQPGSGRQKTGSRTLKIDSHHVRIITDRFVYIEEHPDGTPIAVDVEKFIKKLTFMIGPLSNRKIYCKDRFGMCDEIVSSSHGIYHFRNVPAEVQLKIHKMLEEKLNGKF